MTVNSNILDAQIRHAIGLQRLSKGTIRKVHKLLARAEERILGRVAHTPISRSRQAALIKGIKNIVAEEYGVIIKSVSSDIADLASYEVDYQAGVINKAVPIKVDLVMPSPRQVLTAVNSRPFQGKLMREWLSDLDKSTFARVRDSIRMGYIEGRTTGQMIRDLRGTAKLGFKDGIFEINRRHAETIVRTAMNHTANSARDDLFSANKDVVKEVQWVSVLDGRTSAICQSRDGQTWPVDDGPRPPAHPNAVAKGTLITTDRGAIPVEDVKVGDMVLTHAGRYRRVYTVMCKPCDTPIVNLVCDEGTCISLTNDHPVLTMDEGWVNAGDVNIGSIFFKHRKQFTKFPFPVCGVSAKIPQTVLFDSHSIKTNVREELVSFGIFSCATGMTSAINLKQYTSELEICDVSVNRDLEIKRDAHLGEDVEQKGFVSRWVLLESFRERMPNLNASGVVKRRIGFLHPVRRFFAKIIEQFRTLSTPMVLAYRLRNMLGVSPNAVRFATDGYAKPFAHSGDSCFSYPHFPLDKPDRLSFRPMFNPNNIFNFFFGHVGTSFNGWEAAVIISIEGGRCNSTVYNLAIEGDETYVANGIVVHNCRSSTTPIVKSWRGMSQTGLDAETRASMNGQVPAKTTYGSWLKKQPAAFQDDVLGKTKGKLFRNGGVSVDRFVDYQGHEYTIKELRRREASAFTAAGL